MYDANHGLVLPRGGRWPKLKVGHMIVLCGEDS